MSLVQAEGRGLLVRELHVETEVESNADGPMIRVKRQIKKKKKKRVRDIED